MARYAMIIDCTISNIISYYGNQSKGKVRLSVLLLH